MDLNSITAQNQSPVSNPRAIPDPLRVACNEFEAMLTGIIMKQGLKPGVFADETPGAEILQDFAVEQTAHQLGQAGTFGLGEMLYRQFTQIPGANSTEEPS